MPWLPSLIMPKHWLAGPFTFIEVLLAVVVVLVAVGAGVGFAFWQDHRSR